MIYNYPVGANVVLNPCLLHSCVEPERYQTGVIVRAGSYNIYDVQWNGFERPIAMRGDEIQEAPKND